MIEYIVRDTMAKGDSLGLVEVPVNAEINPALAVFFLSL